MTFSGRAWSPGCSYVFFELHPPRGSPTPNFNSSGRDDPDIRLRLHKTQTRRWARLDRQAGRLQLDRQAGRYRLQAGRQVGRHRDPDRLHGVDDCRLEHILDLDLIFL